ncbi:MAG TPA: hypothetical protein ENK04_13890 [Gammaproteobacteria bacterium]|nr:hypothetical protein [Gammaproteobacteria bacterium]
MPTQSFYIIKIIFYTLLIGITLGVSGCSSTSVKRTSASDITVFGKPGSQTRQQAALSRHYSAWKSTPYKLGGLSKTGVDCSGFVHVTFRDVFNKQTPRSTEQLAQSGKAVTQKSLTFGDLVFFKTGRTQRHVGIYIKDGKFIHASSSRGVIQSSLNSAYWSRHYWKARRISK